MVVFNKANTHASLAFVATGHVVFFDARSRLPVECIRMAAGAGGARQAHASSPTGDDRYVLVANQNGKRFERIATDYATNTFTYEPEAAGGGCSPMPAAAPPTISTSLPSTDSR